MQTETDVQEFQVFDRLGPLTLRGRILASCRWDKTDKPRWTDMVLYGVVDTESEYKYGLEIIARSVIYHRMGSSCVRPRQRFTTVGEVYRSNFRWTNLIPCGKCKPGDLHDLNDNDRIAEEKDKHQLYLCTDAADIVKKLYRRQGEITEIAAKLLYQAAQKDPSIAQAWKSNRRV